MGLRTTQLRQKITRNVKDAAHSVTRLLPGSAPEITFMPPGDNGWAALRAFEAGRVAIGGFVYREGFFVQAFDRDWHLIAEAAVSLAENSKISASRVVMDALHAAKNTGGFPAYGRQVAVTRQFDTAEQLLQTNPRVSTAECREIEGERDVA